jgi:hypothetical protein
MKKLDIKEYIGKKFNRLTILKEMEPTQYSKGMMRNVLCKCDCGNQKVIDLNSVKRNKSMSCGCLNKEIASKNSKTHGLAMLSTGVRHPDYDIWIKMKSRCFNKNDKSYKHYGKRGISVCYSWTSSFKTFINDLGWRPSKEYSLERIDYNKNYCPENCKWILKSEQSKNSRRVNKITYQGKEYCLTDFCKEFSFPYSTMRHRVYDLGISIEEAIKYPQHYKFRKNKLN